MVGEALSRTNSFDLSILTRSLTLPSRLSGLPATGLPLSTMQRTARIPHDTRAVLSSGSRKAMPKKKQSQTVSLKLQSTQPCSHNRAESGMTEARHYRGTRGLITDRNRATLDP